MSYLYFFYNGAKGRDAGTIQSALSALGIPVQDVTVWNDGTVLIRLTLPLTALQSTGAKTSLSSQLDFRGLLSGYQKFDLGAMMVELPNA